MATNNPKKKRTRSQLSTQSSDANEMSLSGSAEGLPPTDLLNNNPSDSIPRRTLIRAQDIGFLAVCAKYRIHPEMAQKLLTLNKFEIVVVIDDSGSMNTPIEGKQCSRWDELREIVKIVVEIGIIFDTNGVDVYFLNSPETLKIKNPQEVDRIFDVDLCGYTPMMSTLKKIFKSDLARVGRDKKLLVIVATDGEPTDYEGNEDLNRFEKVMKETRNQETTFVSFLLCTDVPRYADLFQHYDASMRHVDVIDDYETEKAKVRERMGENYRFEYGDYVVKALIGSIHSEIDEINDPPEE